jgi:predicted nucleic acid-binding protein
MILLDTNVVSEAFRIQPDPVVRAWYDAQSTVDLFLCAPVLAELRQGIERLPVGKRRSRLEELIAQFDQQIFASNFLSVDREAAYAFGRVMAQRQRAGRPIGAMDALIASITLVHGAALATRDTNDFDHLGIELINPFIPT